MVQVGPAESSDWMIAPTSFYTRLQRQKTLLPGTDAIFTTFLLCISGNTISLLVVDWYVLL